MDIPAPSEEKMACVLPLEKGLVWYDLGFTRTEKAIKKPYYASSASAVLAS